MLTSTCLFQEHLFTFVTQKEAVDSDFFQVIDYGLQMLLNQMKGNAYLLEFFVVNRILDGDQMSAKHLIPQAVSIYPIFKVDVNNYATSNQIYFQSFFVWNRLNSVIMMHYLVPIIRNSIGSFWYVRIGKRHC